MKLNNKVVIISALILSIGMGFLFQNGNGLILRSYAISETETSILEQKVTGQNEEARRIIKLYREDALVAIVSDETKLNEWTNEVYETDYAKTFPETSLGFNENIYIVEELSYSQYEDIDEKIFDYLKKEDLFSIEVNRIEFSNGAVIYVKDIEDFNAAREKFVLNFISEATYSLLKTEQMIPSLIEYGTQDVSFAVEENISIGKGLTSRDNVLVTMDEILIFLSYGYNPEISTYTVKEFDTVSTISYAAGMNPRQLMILNPKIKDKDQVLEVGMELNVTYFNSPLTVKVEKERKVSEEIIAGDTIIIEDDALAEGTIITEVEEQSGKADVVYLDTYINGENSNSEQISYTVVEEPVREQIRVGTYVEPTIGSGDYRWPISNGWKNYGYGEYPGHKGTDFLPNSGRSGDSIYPIDRGVVTKVTYSPSWGYYVKINHGNGYESLYAHMMSYPSVSVGDTVTKNTVLGYVGSTGRSEVPHVHLETYYNGSVFDACSILGC